MKAYKLTTLDGKSYVIGCVNKSLKTGGKYCIHYSKNRITKMIPDTIGIMCFDSIDNVLYFANKVFMGFSYILWEIEGYNQLETPKIIARTLFTNTITEYYKNQSNCSATWAGTLCFKKIRLIKEIERKIK